MTLSLGYDELGNQYVDTKGVIWEITGVINGRYKLEHSHGYVDGTVYEITSMSGLTTIICLSNGKFATLNSDGPWGRTYSPSNGKLVERLLSAQCNYLPAIESIRNGQFRS